MAQFRAVDWYAAGGTAISGYIFDNAAEQPTTQRFANLAALAV